MKCLFGAMPAWHPETKYSNICVEVNDWMIDNLLYYVIRKKVYNNGKKPWAYVVWICLTGWNSTLSVTSLDTAVVTTRSSDTATFILKWGKFWATQINVLHWYLCFSNKSPFKSSSYESEIITVDIHSKHCSIFLAIIVILEYFELSFRHFDLVRPFYFVIVLCLRHLDLVAVGYDV